MNEKFWNKSTLQTSVIAVVYVGIATLAGSLLLNFLHF